MSVPGENRMVGLPEIAARTGLSKGFFYNYRSMGRLSLPLQKVGGRLQVREQDLEEWIRKRAVLDSSCTAHLGEELLALIGEAKADPAISAERYPDIFRAFTEKLDAAFEFALESMRADRKVGIEEFGERFEFIVQQVDEDLTEFLPEAAQEALSPIFYGRAMIWQQHLFAYVRRSYQEFFRNQVRSFLYGIKHQVHKSQEEKAEALRFYIPDDLWEEAGYSREDRTRMIEETLGGGEQ